MRQLPLFKFAWFNDFDGDISKLANIAVAESWNYKNNPSKVKKYPILNNYIHHTYIKIEEEGKVEFESDYCCFDTGLVTPNQEEIFAFFEKNKKPKTTIKWYFKEFMKRSDRELMKFSKLPEPVNFYTNASDLIYDINLEFRLNIDHIIIDNKERFPEPYKSMENHQLIILIQGAIEDSKKRIRRNYKTSIPQYFKEKIQLLIPLCLKSKENADLALVIEKENSIYRATTCLTLDMAYNNARLVAKPDDAWLIP